METLLPTPTETKSPCKNLVHAQATICPHLSTGFSITGGLSPPFTVFDFRTAIFSMGPLKESGHDEIQPIVIQTPFPYLSNGILKLSNKLSPLPSVSSKMLASRRDPYFAQT